MSVCMPQCSGMHSLKSKGLTLLCCEQLCSCDSTESNYTLWRVQQTNTCLLIRFKGALPFRTLFFNVVSVWQREVSQCGLDKPCQPPTRFERGFVCVCVPVAQWVTLAAWNFLPMNKISGVLSMSYSALVSVLMAPPVSPLVPACPYERRTLSTVPSPRSWSYSGVQISESCAGASEASALICLGFFFLFSFLFLLAHSGIR